jgi:hypothetical protein
MEIKTLYKLISGEPAEIEHLLNAMSRDGWRPITMSGPSSVLTILLENKIMDEAKLNLSSAVAEGMLKEVTIEEIQ